MNDDVILERREPGIARVLLNRADRLNALNAAMRAALAQAVATVEMDRATRVLVIAGAGGEAFAAGADVEELADLDPPGSEELSLSIMSLHERIAALPIPVVARIDGWCLGGGLELALACDLRVASAEARFGFPEIMLGIMPGGGGLARTVALCGPAAARRLCLTAETVDAAEAQRLGLVSMVADKANLDETVAALARRLAGYSREGLAQIKSAIDIAARTDLASAQRAEAKACALLFGTAPQREAMAAFLAKRAKKAASG